MATKNIIIDSSETRLQMITLFLQTCGMRNQKIMEFYNDYMLPYFSSLANEAEQEAERIFQEVRRGN